MKPLKFALTYFVGLPIACLAAAVVGPPAALLIALFFERGKPTGGCDFQPTEYGVDRRTGMLRVCVCSWCGRTAFQFPGGDIPKSDRCSRPQFGLGDLVEHGIKTASFGLMKKTPGCGCEGIQKALNGKRFVARRWLRIFKKRVPLPWNNPNHASRKFVKMEG